MFKKNTCNINNSKCLNTQQSIPSSSKFSGNIIILDEQSRDQQISSVVMDLTFDNNILNVNWTFSENSTSSKNLYIPQQTTSTHNTSGYWLDTKNGFISLQDDIKLNYNNISKQMIIDGSFSNGVTYPI